MTIIRPAVPADVPRLAALFHEEATEEQRFARHIALDAGFDWPRHVETQLRRRDIAILTAGREGTLIGFVEVRLVQPGNGGRLRVVRALVRRMVRARSPAQPSPTRPRRFGYIEGVYVTPDARRQGVATNLLREAFRHLVRQGAGEVEAAVWFDNEASRRLFERIGFHSARLLLRAELADLPPDPTEEMTSRPAGRLHTMRNP